MVDTFYLNRKCKSILIISDTHFPVHHPDTFKFVKALKKKYKPDLVVQIGDIVDLNNFSRYDKDPNFISPIDELTKAIKNVKEFQRIFEELYITTGNHDFRIADKAEKAGLPEGCLKDLKDVLQIYRPKWKFCRDLKLNWKDEKRRILFSHTMYADVIKTVGLEGANVVHGHSHTKGETKFLANSHALHYGMTVGCLANQKHICFNYSKKLGKKFILGSGVICNDIPRFIPMFLDDRGRWEGTL